MWIGHDFVRDRKDNGKHGFQTDQGRSANVTKNNIRDQKDSSVFV
jgi:hypothetical protein